MVKRPASDLESEAARWFVRWNDPDEAPGLKEQSRWLAWLQRSPRHVAAYFAMDDMTARLSESRALRELDSEEWMAGRRAQVVALRADSLARQDASLTAGPAACPHYGVRSQSWALPRPRRWAAAAVVAAIAVGTLAFWTASGSGDSYRTVAGEQRTVRLADGSVLQLNTKSQVRVSYTEASREIDLRGEALFTVAKDLRRPFVVRTDDVTVRAIGTRFNVYDLGNSTRVAVLEGRVRVSSGAPGGSFELGAGEEAETTGVVARKRPKPNVKIATAWRDRSLVFERARLADVAREFNRYNTLQFRVDAATGEANRLSGTFDAQHPESLLLWLQSREDIEVRQEGDVYVVRDVRLP